MKVFTSDGLKEIQEVEEGDSVLCYDNDVRTTWHEVEEVGEYEIDNPVKIKHKRVDSLIIPANQTVLVFDDEKKWKRAKNIEERDRCLIPLDHDYLQAIEDRFWQKMANFDNDPEYACGLVRAAEEIDTDFLEYIREEKPKREEAIAKYDEATLKKYESFITIDDENVVHLNTKTKKSIFDPYRYLVVAGDVSNYVTTGGCLKVSV